ncbi:MAG: DRTGG domain-containing protein [Desulfobacterium sp.]|jgi:predicted transcriptional regulator|nr:DRTGG domain-containing protein [Desulfobacterium sp.]
MILSEIAVILNAKFLFGEEMGAKKILKIGASDLMSDLLTADSAGSLILTGLATQQAVRAASIAGASAIVLIRGKNPPQEIIDLAREENIPLLTTPLSMFVASGRLYMHELKGLNNGR